MVAQLQNVIKCNAETVSNITITHIQESGLDVKKCALWVTDNTLYMSGDKKGAIVLFNKKQMEILYELVVDFILSKL